MKPQAVEDGQYACGTCSKPITRGCYCSEECANSDHADSYDRQPQAVPYVYIRSEPGLWTVGFYDPDGKWQPESDHGSTDAAAKRVHYLNGGRDE